MKLRVSFPIKKKEFHFLLNVKKFVWNTKYKRHRPGGQWSCHVTCLVYRSYLFYVVIIKLNLTLYIIVLKSCNISPDYNRKNFLFILIRLVGLSMMFVLLPLYVCPLKYVTWITNHVFTTLRTTQYNSLLFVLRRRGGF